MTNGGRVSLVLAAVLASAAVFGQDFSGQSPAGFDLSGYYINLFQQDPAFGTAAGRLGRHPHQRSGPLVRAGVGFLTHHGAAAAVPRLHAAVYFLRSSKLPDLGGTGSRHTEADRDS